MTDPLLSWCDGTIPALNLSLFPQINVSTEVLLPDRLNLLPPSTTRKDAHAAVERRRRDRQTLLCKRLRESFRVKYPQIPASSYRTQVGILDTALQVIDPDNVPPPPAKPHPAKRRRKS